VASSTEPGFVEVFALSGGRMVGHHGFEAGDLAGLSGFAGEVMARCREAGAHQEGSDEARVVAAYLRRRSAAIEVVRLRGVRDLLEAAGRVAGPAGEGATPLS
jgi:DNA polymerase III subunit epsilon